MESSLRSNLAPSTALAFHASRRANSGRSFSNSRSVIAGSRAISDSLRLALFVPVDHTLFPDVPISGEHNTDVHQHLPEAKHLQFLKDDRPGIQEDRLHIEQDEQHGDEVELNGEALPSITDGLHA